MYQIYFKHVVQTFLLFLMFKTGFSSREHYYMIEPNRRISNNAQTYLSGPHSVFSVLECGCICKQTVFCDAAEFEDKTLLCTLFKDSLENFVTTESENGISLLLGRRRSFPMRFDPTYTYKWNRYISPDLTIFSNHQSSEVQKWPNGMNSLTKMPGTLLDTCVRDNEIVLLHFSYEYYLIHHISSNGLVVDFGIAEKTKIDGHFWIGATGQSFCFIGRRTKIVLESFGYGNIDDENDGPNTPGSTKNGSFVLVVNRKDNTLGLHSYDMRIIRKIFELKAVTAYTDLCIAFGLHEEVVLRATIRLLNAYKFL